MRSASAAASATDRTRSPASSALALDFDPGAQPDAHVDARLGQVQRVGVALGPVADDGHLAALDQARVGIGLVVQLGHLSLPLPGSSPGRRWCSAVPRCARYDSAGRCDRRGRRRRSSLGRATRPVRWSSTMPKGRIRSSKSSMLAGVPASMTVMRSDPADVDDLALEDADQGR